MSRINGVRSVALGALAVGLTVGNANLANAKQGQFIDTQRSEVLSMLRGKEAPPRVPTVPAETWTAKDNRQILDDHFRADVPARSALAQEVVHNSSEGAHYPYGRSVYAARNGVRGDLTVVYSQGEHDLDDVKASADVVRPMSNNLPFPVKFGECAGRVVRECDTWGGLASVYRDLNRMGIVLKLVKDESGLKQMHFVFDDGVNLQKVADQMSLSLGNLVDVMVELHRTARIESNRERRSYRRAGDKERGRTQLAQEKTKEFLSQEAIGFGVDGFELVDRGYQFPALGDLELKYAEEIDAKNLDLQLARAGESDGSDVVDEEEDVDEAYPPQYAVEALMAEFDVQGTDELSVLEAQYSDWVPELVNRRAAEIIAELELTGHLAVPTYGTSANFEPMNRRNGGIGRADGYGRQNEIARREARREAERRKGMLLSD